MMSAQASAASLNRSLRPIRAWLIGWRRTRGATTCARQLPLAADSVAKKRTE